MNYLAHALLAGNDDELRVGGLLGDFIKGPLPGALPPRVAAGVTLHRRIDAWADAQPAFRASCARVSAERRRYAGVIVDIAYDHLLARNWSRFSAQPLPDYAAHCYELLGEYESLLPEHRRELPALMRRHDWLGSYRSLDVACEVLERMARHRVRRQPNPLHGAGAELRADYAGFEQDFLAFFPAALAFADATGQGLVR